MSIPRSEYLSRVWADGIFENRVLFITGGAGSIGSAQTRAIVHLGANACIIGRSVEKTESAAKEIAKVRPGAKVLGIGGVDVRNFDALKAAADRCAEELGGIDYVICGAAGNFIAPISKLSPNGFKAIMDIDALGTFNTVKATISYLLESASKNPNLSPGDGTSGGRLISVSATFHYTGYPLMAPASAAKAAVDSIMASVALEYGPFGINANSIAPGGVEGSEGMERLGSSQVSTKERTDPIPSGRWATGRDISDATVYMLSDAGHHVNGTSLVVDGGGWRRHAGFQLGVDPGVKYPEFLRNGEISKHLKGSKQSTL
ncbi:peroxisomal 2 4-dienoyl-CoA reductase sps19 [Fusarium irregulare]|nr:peroxisomal 2 4-dienoyl-CoA reductase sps19 [Fusarium irregulare]